MMISLRVTLLLCATSLLFFGCLNRGHYRYGGAFLNVRLLTAGKQIGVLDPRGPFGDLNARRIVHDALRRTFGKCSSATVYTEDQLNEQDKLPAIYGDQLSEANLAWFVDNTGLDYLILLDVGPGRLTNQPQPFVITPADREASVNLIVYDLADGGELKQITVTGTLNLKDDKKIWELEATEESIGNYALSKAMKRLGKFTDCR